MRKKSELLFAIFFLLSTLFMQIGFLQMQRVYDSLERYAEEICKVIDRDGQITDSLISKARNDLNAELICISRCKPYYGENLSFELKKEIKLVFPAFLEYEAKVRRTIMIGY